MMTRTAAEAYGKSIGCKYYVKNSNGGLLGGFKTLEDAQQYRKKCEREYKKNPWNKTVKVYIEAR